MQVVAHRGATAYATENTLAAFQAALELGADAIELDVRLTADHIPVVYHYAYLEELTTGRGPVWRRTLAELRELRVVGPEGAAIPTLDEVLGAFGGTPLRLEVEMKGPEPETADGVAQLLQGFHDTWDRIEVTSYEAALLAALGTRCPGLSTALLFPRSEAWMGLDFVAHVARHCARQAGARAVHPAPQPGIPVVCTDQLDQVLRWRAASSG